jgi:hypothetical protein
MSDDQNHPPDVAVSLIQRGADLAGAAVGGAAGFFAGGPGGAALGSAGGLVVAGALRELGTDLLRRVTGPQEELRIGAAAAYAFDSINVRIMAGDVLRSDEPWRYESGRGRSAAEEVLDGVFSAAAASWEQRKVRHLGLFYASLAFRADIDPPYANALLRMAESMGYRQFLLMAFFRRHTGDLRLAEIDEKRRARGGSLPSGASYDLDGLGSAGVLGVADGRGLVKVPAVTVGGSSLSGNHDYRAIALTTLGGTLHDLLRLDTVDEAGTDEVWPLLGAAPDVGDFSGVSLMQYKDPFNPARINPDRNP